MDRKIKKVVCAGGVVRKIIGGNVHISLLRDLPKHNWFLPKGHAEKGETVEQAAEREIGEETGLRKLKLVRKLGIKKRFSYNKEEFKTIHYFLFDSLEDKKPGIIQTDEFDSKTLEFKWFPLENLPKIFWQEQKEIIEKNLEFIKNI
ncbi:MAG: NUDIX domain-containing protein [Patescibacteria group bacterium]